MSRRPRAGANVQQRITEDMRLREAAQNVQLYVVDVEMATVIAIPMMIKRAVVIEIVIGEF